MRDQNEFRTRNASPFTKEFDRFPVLQILCKFSCYNFQAAVGKASPKSRLMKGTTRVYVAVLIGR
jgi:hypothetical protein